MTEEGGFMRNDRHDYHFRPAPRHEDGYFVPPAPVPVPKHPDDWSRRELWDSVMAMSRNPVEATTLTSMTTDYYSGQSFGQTLTVLGSPDLIKYLFVDKHKNMRMHPIRQAILKPVLKDGLITAEGEAWRFARKALSPVFVPRETKVFADRMRDKTEEMLPDILTAGSDTPLDISEVFLKLAYGVLSDTLFSGEIDSASDQALHDIATFLNALGKADPLDILMAPKWIPRPTKMGGKGAVKRLRQSVLELSSDRRARQNSGEEIPDDFLTRLLNTRTEEGEALTDAQIEDQLVTFIGAGHETTSRALTWLVYLLSQDMSALEKLEKEVDALDISLPVEDWESHLPWTMACLEETMRLYPPAPIISRQILEDDRYNEELDLPKKSGVMLNLWALHRHHDLWDHPNRFDPKRFLPENKKRLHRFQYLPFGLGHRVCIGQRFAMQEAAIIMAVLFKHYRFILAGNHPWPLMRITTKPEKPLMMKVEPRR
jgi:cytochrome P450